MTTIYRFMDIDISINVNQDLLDFQLVGTAKVKSITGQLIEIKLKSDSFNFIDNEDRNMVAGNALNGLMCKIGRKIKSEFDFEGTIDV